MEYILCLKRGDGKIVRLDSCRIVATTADGENDQDAEAMDSLGEALKCAAKQLRRLVPV